MPFSSGVILPADSADAWLEVARVHYTPVVCKHTTKRTVPRSNWFLTGDVIKMISFENLN